MKVEDGKRRLLQNSLGRSTTRKKVSMATKVREAPRRKPPAGVVDSVQLRDPVHGSMQLDGRLAWVLRHPLLQRLLWVWQTSLVCTVFPGATHNRLSHVLGTAHCAKTILERMHQEGWRDDAKGKTASRMKPKPGQAVPFHTLPRPLFDQIRFLAETAGLVHDLGHGPLSHAFDGFAPFQTQVAELVRQDLVVSPRFAGLVPYWSVLFPQESDPKARVPHEAMSVLFFAQIWAKVNTDPSLDYLPAAIASILLGGAIPKDETCIPAELRPWISFVSDMISGSPWDVDRQDYLKRDALCTGAQYAADDHFLKGMLCWWDGCGYRLGWRHSALSGIEAFVTARGHMFTQVYGHKTHTAAWLMLRRIAARATTLGLTVMGTPEPDTWDALAERYCRLSDVVFLQILQGCSLTVPGSAGDYTMCVQDPEINALAGRIARRSFWKCLSGFTCATRPDAEVFLADLQAAFPGETFLLTQRDPRVLKGFDKAAPVLFRNPRGVYALRAEGGTWFDVSPPFDGLKRDAQKRWRIYCTSSPTKAQLRAMRKWIFVRRYPS